MSIFNYSISKKELKRYNKLFSIMTRYGFEDIISSYEFKKLIPKSYLKNHQVLKQNLMYSKFERIRMVLEELGPTYVKLGQIFSNREDILPKELIIELEKLQDQVPFLENFDVKRVIKEELNINIEDYFLSISDKPLAAASLAQVHKAQLINQEHVVLKIQRPNIKETIESDIIVMKQIARSLDKHSVKMKSFQPMRIVESFERSIREELNFVEEINNIERFTNNFINNKNIYIPKVYKELSNKNIICIEYIDGIKISNIEALNSLGIDKKKLATIGVGLYLEQVLEHGFFHADPHPGNLYFLPHLGKICFIDFGMMGQITSVNRDLLEDLLLYFMQKDVKKIIAIVEKIAIKTEISDRKKLEYEIGELIESTSNVSIENIKLNTILNQFKNILFNNNVILPHYLYMLIRAIIIIEGVGLKLDPKFNVTINLKPYLNKIMAKRLSPKRILKKGFEKFQEANNLLEGLPKNMNTIIDKIKNDELILKHEIKDIDAFQKTINKTGNRLVLAIIIAALSIGSSILVIADMPPKIYEIPALGFIGFSISGILGLFIIYSIIRNKNY
ncbi:ABC1 kinase family protein [Urechidicola croceus]|uniref:ABC1 atypical kinase-like domain-containing protein n=1 Tax=Urechidicola croceus TaxID=1850246 RepID=A0A1D8P7Y0_9FLAO|nr:AarF/ABC1/UbiB kinase family protein [Urechidicola croceus]AOW20680.1 hypothetical protein LPB138_08325 [Urechidicola croceus]